MKETFDATAGAWATLEARAQAEAPDDDHRVVATYQYPDAYLVCSCGTRIDAAHVDQLVQLHRDHAEHERKAKVYRPAARRGLAASRDRLRETTDRKGGRLMPRRMSVSMTLDAVRNRTKTVTRRHVDTWHDLKAGDRMTLIEKGMGLPKGARQVVVAEVELVDVREELLGSIHAERLGTKREGLGHMTCSEFVRFWADGHGYARHEHPADITCRRIEWRYVDAEAAA